MEKSLSYKKQNLSTTPLKQSQTVVSIGNIYQYIIIINSWPFCVCVCVCGEGGFNGCLMPLSTIFQFILWKLVLFVSGCNFILKKVTQNNYFCFKN